MQSILNAIYNFVFLVNFQFCFIMTMFVDLGYTRCILNIAPMNVSPVSIPIITFSVSLWMKIF